jgi:N-acetylneuraminic acid mutarotase
MKGKSSHPRRPLGAAVRGVGLIAALLALADCGGGKSSNGSSYSIGGTISGLTAGSVELIYNDSTTVTIAAGATTWSFAVSFPADSSYAVTVLTQPAGELCEVTGDASGTTLTANVSTVTVLCSDYGQWTWQAGLNTLNAGGIYGTQGAAAASNVPGARYDASTWTDASGTLWLFGGYGYDASAGLGTLNDLWRYSPSTGLWTWVSGGNADNASAVYGTLGVAAANSVPGARYSASSWIDAAGNLWLFGGYGYDSTGALGYLSDLWKYSPSSGLWTWVNGSNVDNASGIYGTQRIAAANNVPGARNSASTWTDASGDLWLFGGYGYDASGALGKLNDLWRYSSTSGQWTWVSGADADNAIGVYGTRGLAATGTLPGARQAANSSIDAAGNLLLFGGYGYGSTGAVGSLNDLWQYSPSSGEWTWISGADTNDAGGVYGTQGVAAAGNVPGARQAANAWIDTLGNLWLFGGVGADSTGAIGNLNDLWKYSQSSGQWTWVNGANLDNAVGVYGSQGIISASTVPGARQAASSWIDASGKLWLFGGIGYGASANGYLNDLWQFVPPD